MSALATAVELPARIRVADGRTFDGPLPPERHQRIQLGLLHQHSRGFVEITPGTRPPGGKVNLDRRRWRQHYLACGAGPQVWMAAALAHIAEIEAGAWRRRDAEHHDPPREEVFVGVTARQQRKGNKEHVAESRFLWVDVDEPDELPRLWALLARRPAHLVVLSGGSGGAHAYWRLAEPLAARHTDPATGEITEPIERFNQRIIHHLGRYTTEVKDGAQRRVFVGADRACADRSRVMRVAGTVNHKTGRYARVAWADFALAAYRLEDLVGDLADMPATRAAGTSGGRRHDRRGRPHGRDPYRSIPPSDYFRRIARIDLPQYGNVRCPHRDHVDADPSCRVGSIDDGWLCHGCGAGGGIYDLASAVLGGPTRQALRGEDFKRAAALVREVYGDHTNHGRTR